jgi:hypothetical protein
MKGICSYDGEVIIANWESGKTYNGLDEHHNPPKFLCVGEVPGGNYWKGKTYFLCRKHHVELHREIKIILNRIAETLKFCNSEDWLCQKMTWQQIEQARQEVYDFTERWIKNGNTE